MDLTIRSARPDDAAGIVAVLNPIIEDGRFTVLDKPLTEEEERRYVEEYPERGVLLVAVSSEDGRIVGIQSIEPFATYTSAFDHVGVIGTFVDLPLRHQGIGTALSARIFAAARSKGFEKILTYVRQDNPASIAFLRGMGFRDVGVARRQARLRGRYIDELFLEVFLDQVRLRPSSPPG